MHLTLSLVTTVLAKNADVSRSEALRLAIETGYDRVPQILTSRSPRGAHPQAAALPSGAASRTDGVLASLRNAATLVVRSQPNTDSALLRELLPRRLTNASSISFPIVGQLAQSLRQRAEHPLEHRVRPVVAQPPDDDGDDDGDEPFGVRAVGPRRPLAVNQHVGKHDQRGRLLPGRRVQLVSSAEIASSIHSLIRSYPARATAKPDGVRSTCISCNGMFDLLPSLVVACIACRRSG